MFFFVTAKISCFILQIKKLFVTLQKDTVSTMTLRLYTTADIFLYSQDYIWYRILFLQ